MQIIVFFPAAPSIASDRAIGEQISPISFGMDQAQAIAKKIKFCSIYLCIFNAGTSLSRGEFSQSCDVM